MFPYENLWGLYSDLVWNLQYPESTIVEAASLRELWALQCNDFPTSCQDPWGVHDHLRHGNKNWKCGAEDHQKFAVPDLQLESRMHLAYQRLDPAYSACWQRFMETITPSLDAEMRSAYGIPGAPGSCYRGVPNAQGVSKLRQAWHKTQDWAPDLDARNSKLTEYWGAEQLYTVQSFVVGEGIQLRQGSWVVGKWKEPCMSNGVESPCPARMWFGKVERMWVHRERKHFPPEPFLMVEWHESFSTNGCAYDAWLQAPLVKKQRCTLKPPVVSLMEVHVLEMCMLDHPRNMDVWVGICKSWHVMGAVDMPCPWPVMMYYPWRVLDR